ncbi:DUF3857 domain-containing protein [Segetibacter koreensis]|uniref:DUF3857 domain-containing protein n=1 Tax=Segetibacter koreensis TaxID=398037 RepID=UPI00036AD611|nr:DUF3857 domain-containing protein [Segetibacter koreensis]
MKIKIIGTYFFIHIISFAFAQEPVFLKYAVNNIAEDLKKDAKAVYRLDEAYLEVLSPSKYILKVHQITTILSPEGAEHLQQSLWFDKFNRVVDIEATVLNSSGRETQKYKKKDFSIQSYNDGISLATDDKIMHLSLSAPEYPCTIDVTYTIDVSGYIDLPNWYMNNSTSSVEQFRYIVKVPADLGIRYRSLNMNLSPVIEDNGNAKVYTWETKNIAVNTIDAGGYEGGRYLPQIEVSPNVFEYDGHKGEFKNWSDFGKWCYGLYEEKDPFSESRTAEIKRLVNSIADVRSKVTVLYDYLKKNMRYVSVQFGIGGYKPFPVRFVDEKKYGDCKALTNYMRNLLTVAGIKSYPALINAGYNKAPVAPEFPQNVFNHVILCVPDGRDSVWLECTSNNSEAGFLGSFTENKNALLLTENGGVIVSTPKSNYNKNVFTTINDIAINEEGGAEVKSTLETSGSFFELLDQVRQLEEGKQNELFVQYLNYKEPDEFHLAQHDEFSEKHQLNLKLTYAKLFDFKAGNKFFFPKTINKLCDERLNAVNSRKIEYVFHFPYKKVDTTIFHLPADFKVESLPENKQLADEYISYKREVAFDETLNTLKIVSTLSLMKNVIAPEQYNKVCELFNEIEKEENTKLVLKGLD